MPTVSTSAGRTPRSARSIAALRSTASGVSSAPLLSSSTSSSKKAVTRAVSAGVPVAVISLPRTWMSAANSRSITCSSSSPEPSRLTIEWPGGITILTWERAAGGSPLGGCPLPRGSAPVRRSSFRISVNSRLSNTRETAPRACWIHGISRRAPSQSSSGRPGHPAAAEHVQVDVRHGLARVGAGVEHEAVAAAAAVADAFRHRDAMRLGDDLGEQPGVRGGERRGVGIVPLGDDEDVHRRLRVDVAERQHPVGLQHLGRGDLLGDDRAEQAVSHTTILDRARRAGRLARPPGPRGRGAATLPLGNRIAIGRYVLDPGKCCRLLPAVDILNLSAILRRFHSGVPEGQRGSSVWWLVVRYAASVRVAGGGWFAGAHDKPAVRWAGGEGSKDR